MVCQAVTVQLVAGADKCVSAGSSSSMAKGTSMPEALHLVIVWTENDPTVWWLLKSFSYFWFACIYVKHLSPVTREAYLAETY